MKIDDETLALISDFVRIDRSRVDGVVVSIAKVDWDGPHTPVLRWVKYDEAFAPEVCDDRIFQTVLHDKRFFQRCSQCGELNNVGHMHSASICQGCAERSLGVVY